MPYHRSIVRVPRNENNQLVFNCCFGVVFYILLNLIFQNYLIVIIVINGLTIIIISGICYVISPSYPQYQIDNEIIEAQVIEYDSTFEDIEHITIAVAIPVNE